MNDNNTVNSRCPTVTVSDDPSQEDAFGTHVKLAEAILDTIREDNGGGTVTLEGSWGSGKSTVVEMIQQRLIEDDSENASVLVFDAWAHQGDPLRRTFLESVVSHLSENAKWLTDPRAWKEKLLTIQRRRRQTETTAKPDIGRFGAILALAIILVPLGGTLIGVGIQSALDNGQFKFGVHTTTVVAGFALALSPFVVLASRWFYRKQASWLKKRHAKSSNRLLAWWITRTQVDGDDAWPILLNSTASRTVTDSIETPDPTSLEFAKLFSDALNEALASEVSDDRKLLLVVDNLDRVDPDDAKKIWATLQAYLSDTRLVESKARSKFWILLPFAKQAVDKLWASENGEAPSDPETAYAAPTSRTAITNGESYIEKYSLLRFDVPPPVISDWKTYLEDLLTKAFPDPEHEGYNWYLVYRIFKDVYLENDPEVTPRKIKRYVNAIGSMHRIWQHDFALEHFAMSVALRRNNDQANDVIDSLLAQRLSNYRFIPETEREDFEIGVAAVTLGVPRAKATQAVLQPRLRTAFASEDYERITALAEFPGFWQNIEEYLVGDSDPTDLGGACLALTRAGLHETTSGRDELAQLVAAVVSRANTFEAWPLGGPEDGSRLAAVARITRDFGLLQKLIRASFGEALPDTTSEADRLSGLKELVDGLDQGFVSRLKDTRVRVNGDPASLVAFAESIQLVFPDQFPFEIFLSDEQMSSVVSELQDPADESSDSAVLSVIRAFGHVNSTRFEPLINRAVQRLQEPGIPTAAVMIAVDILEELGKRSDQAKSELKQMVDDGPIMHHYGAAYSADQARNCSRLSTLYLAVHPDIGSTPAWEQSANGVERLRDVVTDMSTEPDHTLAVDLVDYLFETKQVQLAFRIAQSTGSEAFLKLIIDDKVAQGALNIEEFLNHWRLILPHIEHSEISTLIKVYGQDDLRERLSKRPFTVLNGELYEQLSADLPNGHEFLVWLADALNGMDQDEWYDSLTHYSVLTRLLRLLNGKDIELNLGDEFERSVFRLAKDVGDGKFDDPEIMEATEIFIASMSGTYADRFGHDIAEFLSGKAGDCPETFMLTYAPHSVPYLSLRPLVIRELFEPIVERGQSHQQMWLADSLDANPDLLTAQADMSIVDAFKDVVQRSVDSLDLSHTEKTDPLVRIAQKVGIEPEWPDQNPSDPSESDGS